MMFGIPSWLIVVVMVLGTATGQVSDSNNGIERGCENAQSDIYFLLDSSASVSRQEFQRLKDLVASVVQRMDVSPEATRVGLGVFGDRFAQRVSLQSGDNKTALLASIRGAEYMGGASYTGLGLLGMRTEGFKKGVVRPGAAKIAVVVADGKARHRTDVHRERARLQDLGVWMFALGVGPRVDKGELSTFSSHPHSEFLRHVASFADLPPLTPFLTSSICRLEPPGADNGTCGVNKKTDVVFVYNAAAMSQSNMTHVQTFAGDVIQRFSMTSGNVRVGVVSEGQRGEDIRLSRFIRKVELLDSLKSPQRQDLSTLLRRVRSEGFEAQHGGRSRAKKIVILFLHDPEDVSTDALVEARMAASSITIYALWGGGRGGPGAGDLGIVERLPYTRDYLFRFDSYQEMASPGDAAGKKAREAFFNKLCDSI